MKTHLLLGLGFLVLSLAAVFDSQAQSISGQVLIDGTGDPVAAAEILVMGNGQTFHAFTDEAGRYFADVPEGTYVVGARIVTVVDGEEALYTEYYDDVMTLSEAQFIVVDAGQSVEGINFGVPDFENTVPANTMITVTGTVRDVDGQPLTGATIMVYDYPGGLVNADTALTDAAGRYEVTVPGYVQRLKAWTFKDGYHRQFYKDQPTANTATEIFVDPANPLVTGIDFTLEPLATGGSSGKQIAGEVVGEDDAPLQEVLVVGFHAETEETRFALTDQQGRYELNGLEGGSYYVLFVADGFIPEFFGEALSWEDAQAVQVVEKTMGINARLGGLNRPPIGRNTRSTKSEGQTRLAGVIDQEAGPLNANTLVTLRNAEGDIVAYDLTDERGYYEIDDLAPGSYVVHADRVRFEEATLDVELAEVSFFTQTLARLTLSAATPTSIGEGDDVPDGFYLGQNYPNPFNPSTTISFELPVSGHVTLTVYDVLGREVAVLAEGSYPAGRFEVSWNAAGLPSGLYLYRLATGDQRAVRRMILLQ